MDYLVFCLYGHLASWGEIAVGESRHSAVYPSKSALLGLLAAALGIRRDDEEKLAELAASCQFAVKVLRTGTLLRDYHTTQVPDSVRKTVYRTRRDELVRGKARLGTILSTREYRCDAISVVAVRLIDSSNYTLADMREALLTPKFHLYLGRKSCPLAAPLVPVVISCDGFGEALDSVAPPYLLPENFEQRWFPKDSTARYYWEGDAYDLQAQQTLTRHDQPLSRTRWQFTRRLEHLCLNHGGK